MNNYAFDMERLIGMDIFDIYGDVSKVAKRLSKDQLSEICRIILEHEGNKAVVIYLAKRDGWWQNDVKEYCKAILEACCKSSSMVIALSKHHKMWDDSVKEFHQAVLESKGDIVSAVRYATLCKLWDGDVKEFHRAVLESEDDQALSIYNAKAHDMWDDSVKEASLAIVESHDVNVFVIERARRQNWWKYTEEETETILNKIKVNEEK